LQLNKGEILPFYVDILGCFSGAVKGFLPILSPVMDLSNIGCLSKGDANGRLFSLALKSERVSGVWTPKEVIGRGLLSKPGLGSLLWRGAQALFGNDPQRHGLFE